ncbi:MAG: hypothetical protein K0S47_2635 [Herbinix sp.]|jgi:ABC-type transport system involved in multi-copper enzyme maturation permease subunit|nr:hypothetical protein [Herbinix sp.]
MNIIALMGYEFKKIWKRVSTWIVLVFAFAITLFSCFGDLLGTVYVEGEPVYSHYEEFLTNRDNERALSGRKLDGTLINEMQDAYHRVQRIPVGQNLYTTEEFQTYARPYSSIYYMIWVGTENGSDPDGKPINVLEVTESEFYSLRQQFLYIKLQKENLSDIEVQKHLTMNREVETPFVFRYLKGYQSIMSHMPTISAILILTIAICLAPVFANEYADRTDQLILTAKFGKNKAILAKLLTGICFGSFVTMAMLLTQILPTLFLYGFDGWNAQMQLINIFSTYPYSILKILFILIGMMMITSLLVTSISLFLSAKLRSAFAVIVIISAFMILCVFLHVPDQYRILYQFVNSLPMNVVSVGGTFSEYLFVIFDQCFPPFQAIPVIYGILFFLFLLLSYRSFHNHQIR